MSRCCALTTDDNPFSPFDNFTQWFLFDTEKRYFSCEVLARFAKCSESFTQEENEEEIERAIDEIIACDPLNIRKKIYIDEPFQGPTPNKTTVLEPKDKGEGV